MLGSKRLLSGDFNFGSAPSFDVQLDRLAKIGAGRFDIAALRGHGKFGAAGDVPIVFVRDQCRKVAGHTVMLAEGCETGKGPMIGYETRITNHYSPITNHGDRKWPKI